MLRFFYILVCIQLCFCKEYIDNTEDDYLEGSRSKSRLHRKHTRSPKKSRVVQFDVEGFMGRADDDSVDEDSYTFNNKVRENRRVPTNYGDYSSFIESNENNKEANKAVDYSNMDENGANTEQITPKAANARHFSFHSMSFDDKNDAKVQPLHNHEKAISTFSEKVVLDREAMGNPEKKCSFKNMKMPFFSHKKSTTKSKRQKKRKLFCFNCHKTSSTTTNHFDYTPNVKTEDTSKEHIINEKREVGRNKVSKRAYNQLCPKCIRELLNSLKKKTTQKTKHVTRHTHKDVKVTVKPKSTNLDKPDTLEDNFKDDYYPNVVRKKRAEAEEERERRLKELAEVERKIDSVEVTVPTFTRVSLAIQNV